MIIDDVLSAGTAARESIMLIKSFNATPKVFIIGLDRQEKGTSDISAKAELEEEFNIAVTSIISLDALIQFLKNNDGLNSYLDQLEEYRHVWGA
jgi:orotate phosphoribosyltransferase